MKLPDGFRGEHGEEALDPEVEARLAVIDAALGGGPIPRGEEELARLAVELRGERAEPDPEFAARLDRWAADGFPRADRPGPDRAPGRWARLRRQAAQLGPSKVLAPVAMTATLLVVVGIAISQSGGLQGGDDSGAEITLEEQEGEAQLAPSSGRSSEDALGDAAQPPQAAEGEVDAFAEKDAGTGQAEVAGPGERRVAQDVDLVLATEPEEIREVADGVNEVVNRQRGFVVSSSVQSGDDSAGIGARFRLRIPAGNLQAAVAELSELAHVQSRTDGIEDITGRFNTARERIDEGKAEREGILARLAVAPTDEEVAALRAQLQTVNDRLADARDELAGVRQRVQLVPVSVSIVAENGAGDDGEWGVDDALEDAGDVLSKAAGIALVVGAALLPLAVVAVILALILRSRTNRGRERALDE